LSAEHGHAGSPLPVEGRVVPTPDAAPRPGPLASIVVLASGETLNKAARFLATIVLARSLTLEQFGAVNVGVAAAGLTLMATTVGFPDVGARDVAVRHAEAPGIAGRVVTGRLLALAAVAVPIGAVVLFLGAVSTSLVLVTAAMALGLALSADWLLRGLERMRCLAMATAAGGLVVLVGSLVVVQAHPSAAVALGVLAAAEFLVSALTWRSSGVRRLVRPGRPRLWAEARRSWPVGLAALIVYSYYANLDTLILSVLRSAEEAGLYSAPYRTFLALNVVGTFAAYAYLPLVARGVEHGGDEEARSLIRISSGLRGLCAYSLIVLGVVELVSEDLLGLLFGARFETVSRAFIILCIAIPWYSIAFPVGYSLIARNQGRRFLLGAAYAGSLSLSLNLVFIPAFGVEGAAAATSVALVAGSVVWLLSHCEVSVPGRRFLLTVLIAASAAGVGASASLSAAAPIGVATLCAGMLLGLVALRETKRTAP
jgi:O-antigen/teichoic acid export membrane protein